MPAIGGHSWVSAATTHVRFCAIVDLTPAGPTLRPTQDLDDTESLVMATTQRPLARRCLDDVTGEPAWKTKPSWYQVSAQDRMIPPQTQRWMARRIFARETIELDTSHASFATRPTQVLELITNAATAV